MPSSKSSHPVDRGWAWFVLLGAIIEMVIVMGIAKAGGILFVAYQQRFQSSSTVTSLVATVQHIVYSFTTPVVMTVGVKLTTCRILVTVGGILVSVSYVISALISDISWLIVSSGAINGVGWACVGPTTLTMIGQYFNKRRGFANSVTAAGASAGGLLFAPVMTKLLQEYGFQGCMLLLGAINLHLMISAVLYRPVNFYDKPTEQISRKNRSKGIRDKSEQKADVELFRVNASTSAPTEGKEIDDESEIDGEKQNRATTIVDLIQTLIKFFDFGLFRNPVFVLLQISFALVATGSRLTTIYIVAHAKEQGIDRQRIATLLAVYSAVDMSGRVLIGVVSDLRKVRASVIVSACATVVGVTSLFLQFYTSYWLLMVFMVVLGLVSGAPPALLGVVIVEYLTVKNLSSTLGFSTLFLGLVNGTGFYLSGYLRDNYASYIATFYLIGGMALFGAAIMFMLPLVERYEQHNVEDQNTVPSENSGTN